MTARHPQGRVTSCQPNDSDRVRGGKLASSFIASTSPLSRSQRRASQVFESTATEIAPVYPTVPPRAIVPKLLEGNRRHSASWAGFGEFLAAGRGRHGDIYERIPKCMPRVGVQASIQHGHLALGQSPRGIGGRHRTADQVTEELREKHGLPTE